MIKKTGFTLAEVLITLGIIGVVAAMTIPTLMNATGQAEFKTGFKKAISTLNQAITMNLALDSNDFSLLTNGTDDGSVYYMFTTRMNVVKTTTSTDTDISFASGSNYTLFFNDGMVFSFPNTCGTGGTAITSTAPCDAIIDVNGAKKPNKLTNCNTSSTATSDTGTCSSTTAIIGDRFSIKFYGSSVEPNGPGARYVLYN